MQYWLVKSEPGAYSWERFKKEGKTVWDGVRNYQARNNLKEMKKGNLVLFYHSNEGMAVQGIAKVSREFFQDPGTDDARWVSVELSYYQELKHPVSLQQMKADSILENIGLIRQSRLSVMPLKVEEFDRIISLGMG
ncbi:MAG: EVE domain-containing protein [Bacteroidia bacterium]|jgi:predicted RNA-binding protein with PUA-like domain|nr:EVE domain-containing protein [Bacteroidia bacterium]